MLALILFVFVGLGWVVSRQPSWLLMVMDDKKRDRLWSWYAHASHGLAPRDSDGDSSSDGFEFFYGTDSRNPTTVPLRVSSIYIDHLRGRLPAGMTRAA